MTGEGAQCAEHQVAAVGACLRCGKFICAACSLRGVCAPCRPFATTQSLQHSAQVMVGYSWKGFLLAAVLAFLPFPPFIMMALFLMFCGMAVGLRALRIRNGADKVVVPALIGLGLNGLVLVGFVVSVLSRWSS